MDCNNLSRCISSLKQSGKKDLGCSVSNCLKNYDDRKKVVVEENKKKYELINSKSDKIAVFQVDGGMISSQSDKKCDNLMMDVDSKLAIFIELKGSDLKHALIQVDQTIARTIPVLLGHRVFARIVTSSRTNVPDIRTCPQYINLVKRVAANRGNVNIRANIITEDNASL